MPSPKFSNENHILASGLLFQSAEGDRTFPQASRRHWDIRYYLQPEHINHLNAKIQSGEWLGVHSSTLTKHTPDRCLPRAKIGNAASPRRPLWGAAESGRIQRSRALDGGQPSVVTPHNRVQHRRSTRIPQAHYLGQSSQQPQEG